MKQGEIWLVNLDPTIGSEIRKTRPAIIVNDDVVGRLPLKVIVPITDWKAHYGIVPWMVHLIPDHKNKLAKDSAADCFQIRSVSEIRITNRIGMVDVHSMGLIRQAQSTVLSI